MQVKGTDLPLTFLLLAEDGAHNEGTIIFGRPDIQAHSNCMTFVLFCKEHFGKSKLNAVFNALYRAQYYKS